MNSQPSSCPRCGYRGVQPPTPEGLCPICGAAPADGQAPQNVKLTGRGRMPLLVGICVLLVALFLCVIAAIWLNARSNSPEPAAPVAAATATTRPGSTEVPRIPTTVVPADTAVPTCTDTQTPTLTPEPSLTIVPSDTPEPSPTMTPAPPTATPTTTLTPTVTPVPTETAVPTATPPPTPSPTVAYAKVTLQEIRANFREDVRSQQEKEEGSGPGPEWDSYVESLVGQRVKWEGWAGSVVDESYLGMYRLYVYMDSPEETDLDVQLWFPKSSTPASFPEPGELFAFSGRISKVETIWVAFMAVHLDAVELH